MKRLIVLILLLGSLSLKAQSGTEKLILDKGILPYRTEVQIAKSESPDAGIVYFSDGEKWIRNGGLELIRKLEKEKKIPSATYVFVSTVDPEGYGRDRRNEYFFCNPDYFEFWSTELIPQVEAHLGRRYSSDERAHVGLSFGGMNAAFFSAQKPSLFKSYALLSPSYRPCPELPEKLVFGVSSELRIFLSTGKYDAEEAVAELNSVYSGLGVELELITTSGSHDFENWLGQLEQILHFFSLHEK